MKALTLSLAVLCISSIVALAWVLGKPAPNDPRVARLEADLKDARLTIAQLRRELENKPVSLPAPARADSSVAMLGSEGATASGAVMDFKSHAGGAPKGGEALREMMKNPAMRAMIEQQQAMQVEVSYARLFDQLQLTTEEKAHFKKLLVEKQKAETDLGLKMLDPNLTDADRQKLMAQSEKNRSTFDSAIKTFLNNDGDWNSFLGWEDSKPERTMYESMGRSLFSASNEPLSPEQEQQLLKTMTDIRKSPLPDQVAFTKGIRNPGQMDDATIKRLLEMTDQNNKRIIEQAAQTLSPGQLKTLESYLNQGRTMTETGYKMGKMFSDGGGRGSR